MDLIAICGLGAHPPGETTMETLLVLGECRVVFSDVADPAVFGWLRGHVRELRRPASAREIVESAQEGGEVGLAVWGHPQYSSRLAREVQLGAGEAGIGVRLLGAISPIGSVFARSVNFLGGDYGYQAIQAYDLEVLLARPAALSPKLPLVVFSEQASPGRWETLAALLRRRVSPRREVRVYPSGTGEERLCTVGTLQASELRGAVLFVAAPLPRRPPR